MADLMIKMTLWLLAAMALGFIVAWLLSKIIYTNKQSAEIDSLSAVILERNNMIDKLEKKFRNEKVKFAKISDDFRDSEEALAQKSSLLSSLQNKINNVSSHENECMELKRQNVLLNVDLKKLKELDDKRVKELKGFEEILVLAEEKLEENEKNYKQILKSLDENLESLRVENDNYKNSNKFYEKKITELKEELKLYESNSKDPEFVISKDQFVKIEEQLKDYQEKIAVLKNENNELMLKVKRNFKEADTILEDNTVDEVKKESGDGSMVKVFRETYKKITKS